MQLTESTLKGTHTARLTEQWVIMMLYCVLIGLVLASSYCRADKVERDTIEQRIAKLENETKYMEQQIKKLEDELEYGGKQYQEAKYKLNSKSLYIAICSYSYSGFPLRSNSISLAT